MKSSPEAPYSLRGLPKVLSGGTVFPPGFTKSLSGDYRSAVLGLQMPSPEAPYSLRGLHQALSGGTVILKGFTRVSSRDYRSTVRGLQNSSRRHSTPFGITRSFLGDYRSTLWGLQESSSKVQYSLWSYVKSLRRLPYYPTGL